MTPLPAWTRAGSRTLALAAALMAVLLAGLAVLQYRWVGQVSEAERDRLRRGLELAADRIARDFDREVFRAFASFQPRGVAGEPLAESLGEGWERWTASAFEPSMVEAVYVVGEVSAGAGGIARLDPGARALRPVEWPAELAPLGRRLARGGERRPGPAGPRGPAGPLVAAPPALLLPVLPPDFDRDRRAAEGGSEPVVVVLFDRTVIADEVLPDLVEMHLGDEPRDTVVWVLDRSRRGEAVFASAPGAARPPPAEAEVAVRPMLALRFFPELRTQGFQRFFDGPESRRELEAVRRPRGGPNGAEPWRGPRSLGRGPGPDTARPRFGAQADDARWTLVVARSEGSLEAALSRLRVRNLGVGLAGLGLLGATAVLLLVSARQWQRLTRRELELVAGITHEIRTPLAAIGSAADNLADGVVAEAEQVRRYGSLIRSETHRLGALVTQVLDFAGTAAARGRRRAVEAVEVDEVVDRVLSDHRWSIEEKGFTVERRRDPEAPRALADREALRRALDNVVGNALKYGEAGRWIGIEIAPQPPRAATARSRRAGVERVAVRVRDRGPGIPRAERRRVFEPFYRAAGAGAAHVHGTGLGLAVTKSVLESFGGEIAVEDGESGRGTTVLITLPAEEPGR